MEFKEDPTVRTTVDIRAFLIKELDARGSDDLKRSDILDISKKIRGQFKIKNTDMVENPFFTGRKASKQQITLRSALDQLKNRVNIKGIKKPKQIIDIIQAPTAPTPAPTPTVEPVPALAPTPTPTVPTPATLPTRAKPTPQPAKVSEPQPAEEEGFTIGKLKRSLVRKTTGAKYLGSGTPLIKFLRAGEKPSGIADTIALEHDIRYSTATSQQDVNDADALFINRMNEAVSQSPSIGEMMIQSLAGTAISLKTIIDRLPFNPSERLFVDYKKNKSRPERDTLLSIQNRLAAAPELTNEAISFIFEPETRKALTLAVTPTVTPEKEPEQPEKEPEQPEKEPEQPISAPEKP
jgi:hypothetical protein